MLIYSLYGLSVPTQSQIEIREKKVAQCKKKMGNKWLLALQVQRKDKK